jgi:hypothetical protein
MPLNATLAGTLQGISSIGGNVGPVQFSFPLTGELQHFDLEVNVLPTDVVGTKIYTLPSVGSTPKLFYLETTTDVTVLVNATMSFPVKAGGGLVWGGGPAITSVAFGGNGVTPSTVWFCVVGS